MSLSRLLAFILLNLQTFAHSAVNLPIGTVPDWTDEEFAQRPQVLIYVDNDFPGGTSAKKTRDMLRQWSEESQTTYGKQVSERLASDEKMLNEAIAKEIGLLRQGLITTDLSKNTAVLIVTNSLVNDGKMLVFEPGQKDFTEESLFKYKSSSDPRIKDLALLNDAFFSALLGFVHERFASMKPTYSMIVKSHGGPDLITTHLSLLRLEQIGKETILQEIHARERSSQNREPPPTQARPLLDTQVGISKKYFLQEIAAAGKKGMRFNIIFLESCRSGIGLASLGELPANVSLLYTSDNAGLRYETLEYSELIKSSQGRTISEGLYGHLQGLANKSKTDSHEPDGTRRLLYFLPLALIASWYLFRYLRRRAFNLRRRS